MSRSVEMLGLCLIGVLALGCAVVALYAGENAANHISYLESGTNYETNYTICFEQVNITELWFLPGSPLHHDDWYFAASEHGDIYDVPRYTVYRNLTLGVQLLQVKRYDDPEMRPAIVAPVQNITGVGVEC